MKQLAFIFSLLLLIPLSARAQSDWQVVVFEEGAQAVKVLTPDGVRLSVPVGTLTLHAGTYPSTPLAAVADDFHAAAALNFTPNQPLTVSIAASGSCCKVVRLSRQPVVVANIGGFSPNGRRFAVSYLAATDAHGQYQPAIVTVDVELGAVVDTLSGAQIGGDLAVLRGWNADGIVFMPACYNCDQPAAGSLSRWNPSTDEVTTDVGYYSLKRDVLALTGEFIAPARRADFPLPVSGDQPNVVSYGDHGRVIYYNPRHLIVDGAHWVADGWQILVEHPDAAVLLDRVGVQRPAPAGEQFLVGTPDGWLGTRPNTGGVVDIVHHTLGDLDGKVIARFRGQVDVLKAPALGATASSGGFPEVQSPVQRLNCPNTPPSRLFVGGQGRVIVGGVNLRKLPIMASDTIAVVTTEVFTVISGPNCDPTGVAWWQVKVGSLQGWMAESHNDTYLLEPVFN